MNNLIRTLTAIALAISSNFAFADFEAGLAAYKKQNFKGAFVEFEASAKEENPYAQYVTGKLYEKGQGVTKNLAQAMTWYRKSATLNNADAMKAIAECYAFGKGVKQDTSIAVEWLVKSTAHGGNNFGFLLSVENKEKKDIADKFATTKEYFQRKAEMGDAEAQVNLGYMYFTLLIEGIDLAASSSQAEGWFLKSAEKGNENAQHLLGMKYQLGLDDKRDQVQAARWYLLAANSGNADAQYQLATIYAGVGEMVYPPEKTVPKNMQKALEWASKSSEQNFLPAQVFFASLLLNASISETDHEKAISLLLKASKLVDSNAMVFLGDAYVSGKGVPKDNIQAIKWYRKAIENGGNAIAYRGLGRMYEEGLGVPQDNYQALQYYEKSLDQANRSSDSWLHLKLARMYENGVGTTKDGEKAIQHYISAGFGGDVESMKKLEDVYANGLLGQKIDTKKVRFWSDKRREISSRTL